MKASVTHKANLCNLLYTLWLEGKWHTNRPIMFRWSRALRENALAHSPTHKYMRTCSLTYTQTHTGRHLSNKYRNQRWFRCKKNHLGPESMWDSCIYLVSSGTWMSRRWWRWKRWPFTITRASLFMLWPACPLPTLVRNMVRKKEGKFSELWVEEEENRKVLFGRRWSPTYGGRSLLRRGVNNDLRLMLTCI